MFGPIVCMIGFAGLSVKAELLLPFMVPMPMEVHAHGFGAFGLYLGIDKTFSHDIIGLDGCWRLLVNHYL